MTQTISAAEVKAAGGYEAWVQQAASVRSPARGRDNTAAPAPPMNLNAKGRKPSDPLLGYDAERMNGLETRYASRLESMRRAGNLMCWKFEQIKLRMADGTFYTPDFFIMLPDGSVGFHETKGFWRDDARAKIKIAAELYPMFFFVAVQWNAKAKEWTFERFRSRG